MELISLKHFLLLLCEDIAIEHAVLDRFFDMMRLDLRGGLQIGDRSRHADDFVVGAGRES